MFTIFPGFNLVSKYQSNKKRNSKLNGYIKASIAAIIALIINFLPTHIFGIQGLSVVEQRIIAIFVFAAIMWL
ncbi:MAG: dihydroorotate dehydrogenase, partial [Paludibacteraceae bacterium]|nr:dihydroorotate dehydrogenase [Paludibacteraceae bacterium]